MISLGRPNHSGRLVRYRCGPAYVRGLNATSGAEVSGRISTNCLASPR